jgi:hypothetical protein
VVLVLVLVLRLVLVLTDFGNEQSIRVRSTRHRWSLI